jgi:LacI family transcriptional regulator
VAPTLRDIANACGVSRATVSLVLQDSPRVSEPTKVRVRKAMADMDYIYDRRAAQMRGSRVHTFGLVLTDIHNPALANLAMAVEDAAAEIDCSVVMAFTSDEVGKQTSVVRAMMEHRLDGIVISPAKGTIAQDLAPLVRSAAPFVMVTRRLRDVSCDYVGPNNAMAGRLLAEHLAESGARSLAFLGGANGVSARQERVDGLRDRWKRRGLTWRPDLSIEANALESGGRQAVRILRERPPFPDAIVGYSDTVVRGILGELRDNGIRPGLDVAVAGIDNDPIAIHLTPPLTSVTTHMELVGRGALELLLDRIDHPVREPITRLIKPDLQVRESTALWIATHRDG